VATLLIVGNSEGALRCDAKCHDAKPDTKCDCVCGGRYHALGAATAIDQCRQDVIDGRYGRELAAIARHLTEEATQTTLL